MGFTSEGKNTTNVLEYSSSTFDGGNPYLVGHTKTNSIVTMHKFLDDDKTNLF
jgi:hypothetical protein